MAATLPSAGEALGLARAIAMTGVPYLIGFVVRANGTLLDGAPLDDVVARLDDGLTRPPLGYAGTCVHPDLFRAALETMRSPERFVALVERFGLSVVGGCCGTDDRHIRALAETLVRRPAR